MTSPIRHIPESGGRGRRRGRSRRYGPARAAVAGAVLLTALLGAAGCGSAGGGAGDRSAAKEAPAAQRDEAGGTAADGPAAGEAGTAARRPDGTEDASGAASPGDTRRAASAPSHVIRTATLTVRVKDVPSALDSARTAAENAGGYVGDETTDRDSDGHERSRLVLRVPQEKYAGLLEELAGTGTLIERKVEAEDVTDQVVDVESRVRSQRASVARVRELMDRAEKLSDIVTLEGELSTRQTELEALLARRAALKERTAMATVTLRLTETQRAEKPGDDELSFAEALAGGWNAMLTGLRWLAVAVGAVLPFAAALAVVLLLIRLAGRLLPDRAGREPGPAARPEPSDPAREE
ncbi:DUF4349 domain-containing protein [Streptomyces sp. F63]|uniref:DUF4349 domain-containing protein n=1 Tax=Streptomyces sp. F63 TaxID=2824887 RepID=UPI001B382C76|nr:DUF4349 domain-containing protein [Streptomyces sp. F63]MBQ0986770.1 DUF4349 domain-containing protein [Streptomyces sp. F63]